GHAYADAAPVLSVIVWSIIFGTIGQITNSWIINFGNTKIALAQTAISTSIAICLYPILISNFSLIGAAFAFVFAQMTMNFSLNYFFKSTRPMFIFQMNILFFKKLDPMIIFK
ncbi:MAG: polysaccharide biosynthesis C-terminal domain-containing protein, partial [Deltaproteobacteria bacterium]|nr:polysaccharide biosynthesis C-terminal domain-containing protein [Deltaproteobacteria bacterium]